MVHVPTHHTHTHTHAHTHTHTNTHTNTHTHTQTHTHTHPHTQTHTHTHTHTHSHTHTYTSTREFLEDYERIECFPKEQKIFFVRFLIEIDSLRHFIPELVLMIEQRNSH
jgi:hypothetical protein